ncbi:MAG TPA: DUF6182 family protein [Actinocrinis sp.]|uniref:DUF6182 family protein n=1 Tax=Actinocrinis sp. TaxID=1920516 RepID=UPI002DDD771E|nr:DUF6182 family protein [Actinocrinis sp.]HEV2342657.1 DUF6182 family protein [Actinocrinis sp.]
MTVTQLELRDHAWTRLRRARPDLAPPGQDGADDMSALLAARERVAEAADGDEAYLAVAVVRRFEPANWIRDTCRFALGLTPDQAAAWRHAFTRTVFLAGNPGNLGDRFAFDHVAEDGSSAWFGPAPVSASAGIRRLLKLFQAAAPLSAAQPTTIRIPAPQTVLSRTALSQTALPRTASSQNVSSQNAVARNTLPRILPAGRTARPSIHRDLHMVTVGVQLHQVLVHLHHLLAEAAMDGLIAPGDLLTLRPVPCLVGVSTPFAAIRVDVDPTLPDRLRAYAALTEETVAESAQI